MLFHQLLVGHRQLCAEKEVLEGVAVQNPVHVEGVALAREVEPEVPRAQTVEGVPGPGELAERFARLRTSLR